MFRPFNARLLTIFAASLLTSLVCGCQDAASKPADKAARAAAPDDADLRKRVKEIVLFSRDGRLLNSQDHNAWQVVHGMLAYGRTFPINVDGKVVPALDWVLQGGNLKGWGLVPGSHGVASTIVEGKVGAGHPDQWLGYLSQAGLKIDDEVVVAGRKYTVHDLVEQAKFDIFDGKEAPWVLMATSTYLPLDATWVANDKQTWSTEKILEMEAKRPLADGACGGTHKLFAMSVAVKRYLAEKNIEPKQLTGAWKLADDQIQLAIKTAKQNQQPDGSLSTNFFGRAGSNPEIGDRIYSTGHTLEFLIVAINRQQFEEPWVARAALAMTKLLEQTREKDVECGRLYHAAHGLLLFSQRRYGDLTGDDKPDAPGSQPSDQPGDKPAAKPVAATDPPPVKE